MKFHWPNTNDLNFPEVTHKRIYREETSRKFSNMESQMIPSEQDAFGHQVYDFYQGQAVTEIVERDDMLYWGNNLFCGFCDWEIKGLV